VHEDDALCLALACRALRDALGARFPACPRAGGRAVAELAARVTAAGVLDLSYLRLGGDGGLRALPEGFGRLAYLPAPGLRKLDLNGNLTVLPAGMWSLAELEVLHLRGCGLRALPEGIVGLAGLRELDLSSNRQLVALPAGLGRLRSLTRLGIDGCPGLLLERAIQDQCGLPVLLAYLRGEAAEGVEELDLGRCGLRALSGGIGRLAGLRTLYLHGNEGLTVLPAELGLLEGLEVLSLYGCGLTALPEGIGGLVGLRALNLCGNRGLAALPAGLGRLRNLEELDLRICPGLAALRGMQEREGLAALLAHLAAQGGEPAAGEAG
jgi:hypothetical protein